MSEENITQIKLLDKYFKTLIDIELKVKLI